MPIHITFDLSGAGPHDLGRIQSMFERFGWERLAQTSYRYPHVSDKHTPEDWLNRVIPPLMLFRTFVITAGRELSRFTVSTNTQSSYDSEADIGEAPSNDIDLWEPHNQQFGRQKLWDWLANIPCPYPPDES